MPDKLNHEILSDLVEKVTKIDTTLDILSGRLFGQDGQVGALSYMDTQHKELVSQVASKASDDDLKDLSNKHDELNQKVTWFTGVGATIIFLISTVLTYLGIHYPPVGH